jgi:TrmH family RNA methyltransferase
LLTESQRDRIDVVLVSPRNPLNIGAVARAMANFGFSHLTVAAPYAPNWREARSAIGAPDLLLNAKDTPSLADAVAESTFIAGTGTLTHRKPDQPVISLPNLAPILARQLVNNGRIALVFGSEKHGLTREDLSHCHALIQIPTDDRQPSMNLGQAVAVCLYEVASRTSLNDDTTPPACLTIQEPARPAPRTTSAMLDLLAGVIEQTMAAAAYSPRGMQPANQHDLRVLLRRLAPSALDARRMLGLFRRILWRLDSSHKRPAERPK